MQNGHIWGTNHGQNHQAVKFPGLGRTHCENEFCHCQQEHRVDKETGHISKLAAGFRVVQKMVTEIF